MPGASFSRNGHSVMLGVQIMLSNILSRSYQVACCFSTFEGPCLSQLDWCLFSVIIGKTRVTTNSGGCIGHAHRSTPSLPAPYFRRLSSTLRDRPKGTLHTDPGNMVLVMDSYIWTYRDRCDECWDLSRCLIIHNSNP